MYYKIIKDSKIIDITTANDFYKFQTKHKILLVSLASQAHYAKGINDQLYWAEWMNVPPTSSEYKYETVEIINIPQEEFNLLKNSFEQNKDLIIPENLPEEPEEEENEEIDSTFEFVQTNKIMQMDKECAKAIINGFSLTLSDGIEYHFSLELTDQINIMKLYNKAQENEQFLPYHADGEICKNFKQIDVFALYKAMEKHIDYHTIYYNSLKNYILSLKTVKEISEINYGIDIPEEFQSSVFNYLTK